VVGARMAASGLSGRIRVGYQIAAHLGGWRIELAPRVPRTYTITVQVESWDDHWRDVRPWALALDVAGGASVWQWGPVEPTVADGRELVFEVRGAPTIVRYATGLSREG
jgi:hypothetical protein